ncbi:hypothetical protein Hypma_003643 [Hypsizygus marmoreus]|uniref:Mug135-like C-terminal domain-containing protein n=1 Tax=Hypsizygus marmoreus TaxID=39966 RepID=A0A369J1C1_HYPMA|nr:hypothetical protein Hypma_003643 [Hypsizygus marmoreus]
MYVIYSLDSRFSPYLKTFREKEIAHKPRMPVTLRNRPIVGPNAVSRAPQGSDGDPVSEANVATEDPVEEAATFQADQMSPNAANTVEPPWFKPTVHAALTKAFADFMRCTMTAQNMMSGDGRVRPFRVVPFIDGSLPTDPPHNLPALLNVAVINALTGEEATAYLVGYDLPVPRTLAARKKAIRIEVGCMYDH